jgi:hypothetical protein
MIVKNILHYFFSTPKTAGQEPQFHDEFTKNPSQLPKIRSIANLLSSKLLRWKLENPKISQLPKMLPIEIHPKISQFPIPSPK